MMDDIEVLSKFQISARDKERIAKQPVSSRTIMSDFSRIASSTCTPGFLKAKTEFKNNLVHIQMHVQAVSLVWDKR